MTERKIKIGDEVKGKPTANFRAGFGGMTVTGYRDDRSVWVVPGNLYMYDHELEVVKPAASAQPSPVRTVTTTRQEIVPGVYGKVKVTAGGYVHVNSMSCADELTAAIDTLTAIRDAMQANTSA